MRSYSSDEEAERKEPPKRQQTIDLVREDQFETARRIIFGSRVLHPRVGSEREAWTTAGLVRKDQIAYDTPFTLGGCELMITRGAPRPDLHPDIPDPNLIFGAPVWLAMAEPLYMEPVAQKPPRSARMRAVADRNPNYIEGVIVRDGKWMCIGILRSDVFVPFMPKFDSLLRFKLRPSPYGDEEHVTPGMGNMILDFMHGELSMHYSGPIIEFTKVGDEIYLYLEQRGAKGFETVLSILPQPGQTLRPVVIELPDGAGRAYNEERVRPIRPAFRGPAPLKRVRRYFDNVEVPEAFMRAHFYDGLGWSDPPHDRTDPCVYTISNDERQHVWCLSDVSAVLYAHDELMNVLTGPDIRRYIDDARATPGAPDADVVDKWQSLGGGKSVFSDEPVLLGRRDLDEDYAHDVNFDLPLKEQTTSFLSIGHSRHILARIVNIDAVSLGGTQPKGVDRGNPNRVWLIMDQNHGNRGYFSIYDFFRFGRRPCVFWEPSALRQVLRSEEAQLSQEAADRGQSFGDWLSRPEGGGGGGGPVGSTRRIQRMREQQQFLDDFEFLGCDVCGVNEAKHRASKLGRNVCSSECYATLKASSSSSEVIGTVHEAGSRWHLTYAQGGGVTGGSTTLTIHDGEHAFVEERLGLTGPRTTYAIPVIGDRRKLLDWARAAESVTPRGDWVHTVKVTEDDGAGHENEVLSKVVEGPPPPQIEAMLQLYYLHLAPVLNARRALPVSDARGWRVVFSTLGGFAGVNRSLVVYSNGDAKRVDRKAKERETWLPPVPNPESYFLAGLKAEEVKQSDQPHGYDMFSYQVAIYDERGQQLMAKSVANLPKIGEREVE